MDTLMEFISVMNPMWIYGTLLLAAYLENIIPPVPGDSVVIFGAYLVGLDKIEFFPSLIMTTVGSLAGFMTYYIIGRYSGREFFIKKNYKWFDASRIEKVDFWFKKWGILLLIGNRFLAGTRSVVSLFAGFSKLGWIKVALLAFLSSLAWNSILITAGYYAGKHWKYVQDMVRGYNIVVSMLIVFIILGAVVLFKKRNKPASVVEGS